MRTSYFLYPEDSAARRELFDLLRVAYDIRSSFVHGSRVDEEKYTKKLQKMKNNDNYSLWYSLPDELNKVLAGVLLKILINQECLEFFSGNPDSIAETEFYDKLVLGNR